MSETKFQPKSIVETILVILLLLGLLFATFEVLRAFFGVLTFALIFSVSFATPFKKLTNILGNRKKLAATIYAVLLIALVTFPFVLIVSAISNHIKDALTFISNVKVNGLPPLPTWIANLPLVGNQINSFWNNLPVNPTETIAPHELQVKAALNHVVSAGTGIIGATIQFILGIIISAFFLVSGEKILLPIKAALKHLFGARNGIELLEATGQAVKGVSIGVMGTAFFAAIISWIGFKIAGIPFALPLAGLVFFVTIIQIGPLLVWVPVIIWYSTLGHTGYTIFLIIYAMGVLMIDAVVKPILIAKSGGRLPFLVLFLGVLGGLAAWGFTGMFKGAIVMAIAYTVFTKWLENRKRESELERAPIFEG
ncbi:AI-2E family transporter [Pedobacter sp. UYP30]|uniref:AI-2E family transporter n=1 Tax=Pedobacter sp. UYP30 TaxID=1756400 RepID=UPI003396AFF8